MTEPAKATRLVAIVVHNDAALIDFAGPAEVFEAASRRVVPGVPAFKVFAVGPTSQPVLSQRCLKVAPEYSIENCPAPDIVVIPGGGTGVLRRDDRFMAWLNRAGSRAEVVLSVSTGAFAVGDARLFEEGDRATASPETLGEIPTRYPGVEAVADRRVVDAGRVVTCGAGAAGIDGALHVVARLCGKRAADLTAAHMGYAWTPDPELAASYSTYPPGLDEEKTLLIQQDEARAAADWPKSTDLSRRLTELKPENGRYWYMLGYSLHYGGRLDEAIEVHRRAAEFPDWKAAALYNLACAQAVKGDVDGAVESLRESVAAGFNDEEMLRHDDDLASVRADDRFEAIAQAARAQAPR